jgi:hypothetical protein
MKPNTSPFYRTSDIDMYQELQALKSGMVQISVPVLLPSVGVFELINSVCNSCSAKVLKH